MPTRADYMDSMATDHTWQQGTGGQMDMHNEFGDLTSFIDFGEMELGLGEGGGEVIGSGQQVPSSSTVTVPDITAEALSQEFMLDESFALDASDIVHQQAGHGQPMHMGGSNAFGAKPVYQHHDLSQQFEMHQIHDQLQQHSFQHDANQHHHVPPTPQSFEMQGEAGKFLQHQHQQQKLALSSHQHQMRNDDATTFTPMASPDGTPLFNMLQQRQPEYTIPGAYFSPLTSPMIHAQQRQQQMQQHQSQHQHQQGYFPHQNTTPGSHAPSPIDTRFEPDLFGADMALPGPATSTPLIIDQSEKPRRKATSLRSTGASSGAAKPTKAAPKQKKRKSGVNNGDVPDGQNSAPNSNQPLPTSSSLSIHPSSLLSSSETDSVSPDALSDVTMPPPPRPGSASTSSPAIIPQQHRQHEIASSAVSGGPAATPKSLLNGRGGPQVQHNHNINTRASHSPMQAGAINTAGALDDLALPEAAAKKALRPSLSRITTSATSPIDQQPRTQSQRDTPRTASRKTPKLGPDSTPSSARPTTSTVTSPSTAFSPQPGSTPGTLLKGPQPSPLLTPRLSSSSTPRSNSTTSGSRKRNSTSHGNSNSNATASPALRPRISPSIKPLLPEGTALNSSAHALLLASKSNYQNLLEGNRLPGVSYPESLSTGLTSKRTSHKVAEQGRRNRINDALKEMQALLPPSASATGSPSEKGKSSSPNEKAGESASPGNANGGVDHAGEDPEDRDGRAGGGKEGKSGGNGSVNSSSSKAATVESANEYIRKLQAENAALLVIKREHEEMKRRLHAKDGVNVVDATTEDRDQDVKRDAVMAVATVDTPASDNHGDEKMMQET